jgi:hypothetical protein
VTTDWPADADGDVFRRLQSEGFDFTTPHKIDFQIDFGAWPPPDEAIVALKRDHKVERHEPEKGAAGYIQVSIFAPLTYDFVVITQDELSRLLLPFGGVCEAWGVLS